MHRNDSGIFTLRLVFACLATAAVTAVLVGTEARISNGLALTDAEYMMAVGASDHEPGHRTLVEAR